MRARFVAWGLGCFVVACGGAAWWMAERMPVEVLMGMGVVGWGLVAGTWLAAPAERGAGVYRLSVYVAAVCVGAGVVERFWTLWSALLPADPWGAAFVFPAAVAAVQERIGGWRGATPWVAGSMTLAAIALVASEVWRLVGGGGRGKTMSALDWVESRGAVVRWSVIAVAPALGAAAWAGAPWMAPGGWLWMVVGGWGMLLGAWYMVPEERGTALLRVSVYVGAGCIGCGVFEQFWEMWDGYLPADPWRAALALPGAVVEVDRKFAGAVALSPWMAGFLACAAGLLAVQSALGRVFGREGSEAGRRTSESELFGKSRLMARRMMRRMSRDGGIILGAMEKGSRGELVTYALEGAKLTVAPPRSGKTAGIAANLLAPGGKGYVKGSTMIIDPRGELFFITAARRKALGRNVVLVDPFGLVKALSAEARFKGVVRVPTTESVTFNPLDFIRDGNDGVGDIRALLEGLLTAPAREGADNARHFYESARAIMSGVVAYVHWSGKQGDEGTWRFSAVRRFLMPSKSDEKLMRNDIEEDPSLGWGLPRDALGRMDKVGQAEGGSNYSTIANQVDWVQVPELEVSTGTSTFDPMVMAKGNTDLFVVVPEEKLEASKAWLRMWVVTVNAVAARKLDHAGITIVLDEAPRLGYLKPVMDSFYMAAGKGIRYEVFSQAKSAMDSVYQRENMEIMTDLSEVFQILEFPRANPEFADRVSKMIGNATFENVSRSEQGTVSGEDMLRRQQSSQAGTNRSLVKERLIAPEDLMMLDVDEQIVLTNSKVAGREAMKLFRVRYWERADMKHLAAPNPYVVRKDAERKAA